MTAALDGRAFIVTGAASGLGLAMTEGLLAAGARVTACDLDEAGLARLARARTIREPDRLVLVAMDVRDAGQAAAAVERTLAAFGRLDGVVNNAGIGQEQVAPDFLVNPPPFWTVPPALWRRIVEVNAIGPFNLAHAAVPVMLRERRGRIVNVTTSIPTMLRAGMAPYGGSKAATEAHSAIIAQDLAGTGVTVNVLIPGGPADTAMVPGANGFPRARLLRPAIMVPPLLWLLSDAASNVTGRRFVAALWDGTLPAEIAAAKAGAPVAWPIPAGADVILADARGEAG